MPNGFGALSDKTPDYLYAVGDGRHVYATPWLQERPLRRCAASIVLTVSGKEFELTIADRTELHRAVAVKPMVLRALHAHDVGLVGFQLTPAHPLFRRFRRIGSSGVMPLQREMFSQFDSQLAAAYQGELTVEQAELLFDGVMETALPYLPKAKPMDTRVERAIELLWQRHDYPLSELAAAVGLSYFRLSHLFSANMGMPLRNYQQWRKVQRAISLSKNNLSLAELAVAAGFTDAAHFSRVFAQLHAAPPSYFLQNNNVRIISRAIQPPRD